MSLVAYLDSDCESDEDNKDISEVEKPPSPNNVQEDIKPMGIRSLLRLPQPKSIKSTKTPDNFDLEEEEKLVLTSKKPTINCVLEKKEECPLFPTLPKPKVGGKVKILLPSLNEVNNHI
jgi:hypothetical protein